SDHEGGGVSTRASDVCADAAAAPHRHAVGRAREEAVRTAVLAGAGRALRRARRRHTGISLQRPPMDPGWNHLPRAGQNDGANRLYFGRRMPNGVGEATFDGGSWQVATVADFGVLVSRGTNRRYQRGEEGRKTALVDCLPVRKRVAR